MGILSDIGNLFTGGGAPNYSGPDVNKFANEAIAEQRKRSQMTDEQRLAEQMQGVDQTQHLAQAQEEAKPSYSALGSASPDEMNQAIRNKYAKQNAREFADLNKQQELETPINRFQDESLAAQNQMAKFNMQSALADRQRTQQINRQAARNQVIGDILGIAGAGAGFLVSGGNPAGAAIGMKVGSGMAGNTQMQQMGGGSGANVNAAPSATRRSI